MPGTEQIADKRVFFFFIFLKGTLGPGMRKRVPG